MFGVLAVGVSFVSCIVTMSMFSSSMSFFSSVILFRIPLILSSMILMALSCFFGFGEFV